MTVAEAARRLVVAEKQLAVARARGARREEAAYRIAVLILRDLAVGPELDSV
jgi:hypothetical protein